MKKPEFAQVLKINESNEIVPRRDWKAVVACTRHTSLLDYTAHHTSLNERAAITAWTKAHFETFDEAPCVGGIVF